MMGNEYLHKSHAHIHFFQVRGCRRHGFLLVCRSRQNIWRSVVVVARSYQIWCQHDRQIVSCHAILVGVAGNLVEEFKKILQQSQLMRLIAVSLLEFCPDSFQNFRRTICGICLPLDLIPFFGFLLKASHSYLVIFPNRRRRQNRSTVLAIL